MQKTNLFNLLHTFTGLGVEASLCDWRYIEFKRDTNELGSMLAEYSRALAEWPDPIEQKRRTRDEEQQRRLDLYAHDLTDHARDPNHVPLPTPPPLVELEPEHGVSKRAPGSCWSFERVQAWSHLVAQSTFALRDFEIPVFQTAYNAFGTGPVAEVMDAWWAEQLSRFHGIDTTVQRLGQK